MRSVNSPILLYSVNSYCGCQANTSLLYIIYFTLIKYNKKLYFYYIYENFFFKKKKNLTATTILVLSGSNLKNKMLI